MTRTFGSGTTTGFLEPPGELTGRLRAHGSNLLHSLGARLTAAVPRWRDGVVAYAMPAAVAAVAVAWWFRPGTFVAFGDVPPFVRDNLRAELWSSWNHQLSGAGSASYDVGRLLDVIFLRSAELLGLPATAAQQALYVAIAALVPCGVAYWARGFGLRPAAAGLAALIGVFNPYVMVNLPNPLPLMTVGVAGALGGLVVRAGADARRRPTVVAFALVTLPVSYIGLNPPLVAILVAWVGLSVGVVAAVDGRGGVARALKMLVLAAPLVVLLHLWWLIPAQQTVSGEAGVQVAAVTDIDEWAWTQAENNLANVTTLRAFWGWPYPEYVPYADQIEAAPWNVLAWALPAAAAVGALLAQGRNRWAVRFLGAAAVVMLVLAKGIHEPFGDFNRMLYDRVPGFWLLREPMSKLGALLVPVYALLVAVGFDRVIGALRAGNPERGRVRTTVAHAGQVIVAVGCVVALAYPWPMWTGDVIPARRGQLPGGHVTVPETWEKAADLVNRSPVSGKALVLPLDPQYQMLTTWGYQGIDVIPQQLFTRPVIQPLPDIYFGASAGFVGLVQAVQDGLEAGDTRGLPPLLDALGVSHVLIRRDIEPSPLLGPIADPVDLASTARQVPGWHVAGEFDVVDVLERDGPAPLVRSAEALTSVVQGVASDPGLGASVVAAATADELVAPGSAGAITTAGTRRSWAVPGDAAATSVELDRPGSYRVSSRLRSRSLHLVSTGVDDAGEAFARATSNLGAALDEHLLYQPSEATVALAEPAQAVDVGGTALALGLGDVPVLAGPGEAATLWGSPVAVPVSPVQTTQGCGAVRRPQAWAAGGLDPAEGGVQVRARPGEAACAVALAQEPVSESDVLRITFEHRAAAGLGPQVCIRETPTTGCLDMPGLLSDQNWRSFEAYVHPRTATPELRIELATAAGQDDERPSVVGYRYLTVERLSQVGTLPLAVSPESTLVTDLDAGAHALSFSPAPVMPALQFGKLEDCFAFEKTPIAEAALALTHHQERLRLSARSHSACTSADVDRSLSSGLYQVAFDYRTLSGNRARACLWQVGLQRCARMPELGASDEWTTFAGYVRPDPGTTGLRMFLYADGDNRRVTTTEFRNVQVKPVASVVAVVTETASAAQRATVAWERLDPSRYDVQVDGAAGSFALALSEAHVPGWRLDGLPEGWKAEHLLVNGYANGWWITGTGSAHLRLSYAPAHQARSAAALSGLTLVAMAGTFALRRRWRT